MGYATGRNYDRVVDAVVLDGVNVVIWSFVDIVANESNPSGDEDVNWTGAVGYVKTNLNLSRIASLIIDLDSSGHSDVLHLTSIGGWNGRHLNSIISAIDWYDIWTASDASGIFHGIDWDLEGNDDIASPDNYFPLDCLDAMINISRLMKEDGYVVTMAPPQSYLNFDDPSFGRYVNTTKDRGWHDEFGYFGNNAYAYLLIGNSESYIDLISIQLYESYSNAAMSIYRDGTPPLVSVFPRPRYRVIRGHVVRRRLRYGSGIVVRGIPSRANGYEQARHRIGQWMGLGSDGRKSDAVHIRRRLS